MTIHTDYIAEGLIDYLHMFAPEWGTKLTLERLAALKALAAIAKQRDDLLAALEVARGYVAASNTSDTSEGDLLVIDSAIAGAKGEA